MRGRLLLLLAAAVAAAAVTVPASAVVGGTPGGEGHPYVAFIRNAASVVCSGAAVSPRIVVTAAHCFAFPTERVELTFASDRRAAAADFRPGTWVANPGWCPFCGGGLVGLDSGDVAVVVLDEPVELPRYAAMPAQGLVETLPSGTRVETLGYGVETFEVGGGRPRPARPSGLRMVAQSVLSPSESAFSDELLRLSANGARGKGGSCFGDSGGPNLLAGTDTILGVNAFVPNGGCNGVTYSSRADLADVLAFVASFGE